jgi:hypothetical protein
MQNSEQKKKLLTTGDIAAHCEVSYETVANWIKGGKLKSHQTPRGATGASAWKTSSTSSPCTTCRR